MTIPWKRRVLAKLDTNKRAGHKPANIEQLRDMVKAPKGGLNGLFDLEREPQQLTSSYAEEITAVLAIEPPLVEEDGDDEQLIRDVQLLRALASTARRDLMIIAQQMPKKSK